MKNLSDRFYKDLPMHQRFAAAIAAIGRNDGKELDRLKNTSPDGEYVINKLSARINDLNAMSMAIRLTLFEELSNWLLAQTLEDLPSEEDKRLCDLVITQALEEAASVIVGRDRWLAKIGISQADFEAYDGPQSDLMGELVKRSRGKENPERVDLYETLFIDFFQKRHPPRGQT